MASWLVCLTPDQVVWVRVLARYIVLCSWARHFTLMVPLKTQAPVVRKPISVNPRLNSPNPQNKFTLRLNTVAQSLINTIQGIN